MSEDSVDLDLVDLESELCRLPGVIMTRFVRSRREQTLGATLFVAAGTPADQLRTNVAAVASIHFGIRLDPTRMVIIEVGQTSVVVPATTTPASGPPSPEVAARTDTRRPPEDGPDREAGPDPEDSSPSEPVSRRDPPSTMVSRRDGERDLPDGRDSQQALESAQQAVSTLLDKLKSATPEENTVVVTGSDTVVAGPPPNRD